jgi:hypothetical protein
MLVAFGQLSPDGRTHAHWWREATPIDRDALSERADDLLVGPVADAVLFAGGDVARDHNAPRSLERNTSRAYPRPVATFARQRRGVAIHTMREGAGGAYQYQTLP